MFKSKKFQALLFFGLGVILALVGSNQYYKNKSKREYYLDNVEKNKNSVGDLIKKFDPDSAENKAAMDQFFSKQEEIMKHFEEQNKEMDKLLDSYFNDDFFGHSKDPFQQMNQMRQRFNPGAGPDMFDDWFGRRFGGNLAEIKTYEDKDNVFYELTIENLDEKSIDIKIENNMVQISGGSTAAKQAQNSNLQMESRFSRSLPVPPGTDADKVSVESKNKKILLKFPKKTPEYI